MSKNQCCLFVHNFAYFSFFFWKPVFSKIYLNKFKIHHLYMYLYLCVWINLYNNNINFYPFFFAKMNGLEALIGPLPSFLQGYSVATISKYNLPSCKSGQHILREKKSIFQSENVGNSQLKICKFFWFSCLF